MIETAETQPLPTVDLTAPDARLGDKAPKTMEQVRAERYEKTAAAATGEAGAAPDAAAVAAKAAEEAAAEAAKKAGVSAPIAMDEAALKAATALSRETREAKAKAKELEAKLAEAAPTLAAKALAAQGKHAEAMKVLGIDLNAAVAETLAGPGEAAEPTPEAKELARQAAELAELKARDAERDKRDKEAEAKGFEAAKQADIKAVGEYVKKEAAKYPYLSRSDEWIASAYADAEVQTPLIAQDVGKKIAELTPAELQEIVIAALGRAEAKHVANAKLYGVPLNPPNVKTGSPPSTPSARPTTFSGDLRGGTATPVAKQRSRMTFSEAKRARREATNG